MPLAVACMRTCCPTSGSTVADTSDSSSHVANGTRSCLALTPASQKIHSASAPAVRAQAAAAPGVHMKQVRGRRTQVAQVRQILAQKNAVQVGAQRSHFLIPSGRGHQ